MVETEDQALTVYTRRNYRKKENHHHNKKKDKKPKKFIRDSSNIRCYTCDEKGHFARDCPKNKDSFNENKKRHNAHTDKYNKLTNKIFKREKDDSYEEYVLIATLMGTMSHVSNDWLVDSGESKLMAGYKESFVNMSEHESPHGYSK